MSERLDALVARKYTDRDGNEKTSWTKIGAAFPTQNGGYSITLEALPLPTMGDRGLETRIVLMVPKPREDGDRQDRSQSVRRDRDDPRTQQGSAPFDDDLPF
jgi:hypothetical protein